MTFPTYDGKYRPIDLVSGMHYALLDAILNSPQGNADDFRCLADYFAFNWIESKRELDHFQPPSEERVGEILHSQGCALQSSTTYRARENSSENSKRRLSEILHSQGIDRVARLDATAPELQPLPDS